MRKLLFLLLFILSLQLSYSQDLSIDKSGGIQIQKVNAKEYIFSFKISIDNTSSKGVGLTIKKGKLYKDGEYLGTVQLLKKIKLKNAPKENLDINIKVLLEKEFDIVGNGLQILMGKNIELKISGIYKATWFIFWKKYPFEYQEKISLNSFLKN